jgi:hypothetical protein
MRPIRVLAAVLLFSAAAFAQTNRGGIAGTVLDQNGAAIPGATVTVTNVGTGQKQTLTTSEDGAFSVQSLDPVVYSITVAAQGFKTATVQSLKVDTATTATANVIMEAGAVGEQITVVADAPLLNTESGTTTSTITERQIQDIPLANRSVLDLAVTAPNISGDAGSEDPGVDSDQPVPGFNLSANGGRPGSTAILADGVNNTGVGIARSVVSFTPETVQEFTVQTSAYSAEYGNTGGGVINASTKSGTNDFNGVALWYTRNPKFNARRYRIGEGPRPANNLRYNQVSFTVGGPVYLPAFGEGGKKLYDGHNRTFFFFAYEPRWRRDFLSEAALVPSLAERAGDFRNIVHTDSGFLPADVAARFGQAPLGNSNIYQQFTLVNGQLRPIVLASGNVYCQFGATSTPTMQVIQSATGPQCRPIGAGNTGIGADPNLNVIPSAFIDPIAPKILQFQPVGGDYFLDEEGLVRNYLVQRFVTQDETRYTLRLDHNVTENNKANFRYTRTPAVGLRGFGSDINGNTGVYSNAQQYLFSDNHIFSPTIVNDLRLNYTRGNFSEDFTPEFSILGGRSLARELGLPTLTQGGIPLFQIAQDTAYSTIGGNIGSSGSTNNFNLEQRYNISDIVYWNRGNMSWKFGVDLSDARLRSIPFFGASGGRWEFRTLNTAATRSSSFATNGGNTLASLLIGVPNVVQVRPLLLDYDYRWKSGAVFVQNDWKLRPNLTVNLGLRYSLQYPRTEKHGLQGVFRPDLAVEQTLTATQRRAIATGLGLATTAAIPDYVPTTIKIPPFAFAGQGGRSKYLTPVDYMGFEPRFGFAYSPKLRLFGFDTESRSLVIRGGYGISHAPLTGNNRSPNPDFGGFTGVSTVAGGSTPGGTADPTRPVRLSDNPPVVTGGTLAQRLGADPNGLVFNNSLGLGDVAVAVADSGNIPYSQNWNLSLSFEPFKNTAVEIAYVGNKGTHLYMPRVNINPKDPDFVELLETSNIGAETTFSDPLGRTNVLGATVAIQRNSITAPFFGFNNLFRFYDPSANSIRHAGYVDVRRRVRQGLTFTANYTYGKSIDDASDASPDTRVLTSGSTLGHVTYGVPRSVDRSVSAFDVKHVFSSTFVWDLPIGRKRWLLADAPGVVDAVLGGWSVSGLFRVQGGLPFLPYITDTNRLGGINRTIRLDIVEGVPLKNPRYDSSCQVGAACEPYVNPAAFMRPVKGQLGNAPRTIDALRGPNQEFFDLSFQKNFPWPFARNEKRRINFRVDLLNALNHPNFRLAQNGNTPPGFGGLPTEGTISNAEYDAWAAFSPSTRPARNTAAGAALLTQINNQIVGSRLPSGAIPANFFHVPIPEGFRGMDLNSFNITNLSGLKLYRLRQQYNTSWGVLSELNQPRYVQFGIRIFF